MSTPQSRNTFSFRVIARHRCGFATKFGVPRQSGLIPGLRSTVVFEPEFRVADALRGLEGFSHIWLVWAFSETAGPEREDSEADGALPWSPTVRPPRLGGNARIGVFATRSPFRPNPVALSCVRLEGVVSTTEGPVLRILGADLMDGTPILDIKPYVPYADCIPDAQGGFAATAPEQRLRIVFSDDAARLLPPAERDTLASILAADPRPAYHAARPTPSRAHGFVFNGREIRFRVDGDTLTVLSVLSANPRTAKP